MVGQKGQVVIGFRISGVVWFGGIDIAGYLKEGSEWVLVAWGAQIRREKFIDAVQYERDDQELECSDCKEI